MWISVQTTFVCRPYIWKHCNILFNSSGVWRRVLSWRLSQSLDDNTIRRLSQALDDNTLTRTDFGECTLDKFNSWLFVSTINDVFFRLEMHIYILEHYSHIFHILVYYVSGWVKGNSAGIFKSFFEQSYAHFVMGFPKMVNKYISYWKLWWCLLFRSYERYFAYAQHSLPSSSPSR